MTGVSTDVPSLMITVNDEVQPHQLCELLIVVSQHVRQVCAPIQFSIDGSHLPISEHIPVDQRSDNWKFGQQIHRIFICILPVSGFWSPLGVSFSKLTAFVESSYSSCKLSHRVKCFGEVVQHVHNVVWKFSS